MSLLQNRPYPNDPPPDDGVDTAVLVARAKQGNVAAFGQLYRQYVTGIYDYVLARLGNREDAEDVTQTVFLRAAQSIHQCRDDGTFAGWLFGIARNISSDKLRSRRKAPAPLPPDAEIVDSAATPEEAALRSAQRAELNEARERCLTDIERELFDLLFQDLTYSEIAVVFGRRVSAVRTRTWRLFSKLRACLGWLMNGGSHETA